MNFTKFLIIDLFLILFGLPLLLIIEGKKAKASLLSIFDDNGQKDQASINIPPHQKLLELEKISRKDGSGIESESLIGLWKFVSVWKKGEEKEDPIASSLLRIFSASLEITKDQSNQFGISNYINFGLLSIRFSGAGNLKGKQPLLPFFFEYIELKAASSILLSQSLKIPEESKMPFFGLIAMGKDGKWLSARGRGGGLALWVKG